MVSEESYKNLLKNCLNKGHESVLEHEKLQLEFMMMLDHIKT